MNKKILAAAALAIVSGSAMADAMLYGVLDASVTTISNYNPTNQNFTGMQDGLWMPSLWGIKGGEDLGDGMKADFDLQSNLTIISGTNNTYGQLFNRNATVGLSGDFGHISAGERLDPLWIQSIAEQAMGVHHSGSAAIASIFYHNPTTSAAVTANTYAGQYGVANVGPVMSANWLMYDLPKLLPDTNISVGYQFGNQAGSQASESGYYLGGTYSKNGLQVNLANESQNNSGNTARINKILIGAMYTVGQFTVEAQTTRISTSGSPVAAYIPAPAASNTSNKVDANVGQVGLAYDLTPKLKIGAQYVYINDNANNARPSITSVSGVYSLSARTKLYLQIENNNPSNGYAGYGVGYSAYSTSTTSNASLVGAGVTHYF
jgi:hypothetical protein